mgnify:CR=1 FL=1
MAIVTKSELKNLLDQAVKGDADYKKATSPTNQDLVDMITTPSFHPVNGTNAVTITSDTTIGIATHGFHPLIVTGTTTLTLPAVTLGHSYWIINGNEDGTGLLTINPNSSDKFLFDAAGAAGTNDKDIMLLWLLNDNTQLTVTWGFVNSLKNEQIEYVLINNLKTFGVTESEFKSMISFGKSKMRETWQYLIYNQMYQANSLFTYSDIDNYTDNIRDKIIKISPFRAQSLVIPENEKEKLVNLFNRIELNEDLNSEIVVINKIDHMPFNQFKFRNKSYDLAYSGDIYNVYILKK